MLGMRKWNDLRKDKSFLKHTGSIQLGRGRSALPAINVYESGTWNFPLLAHQNFDFAQLYRAKNNPELAQQHYQTAHQLFTQLGAAKDLEKLETDWHLANP
jgi:hypothetical protein